MILNRIICRNGARVCGDPEVLKYMLFSYSHGNITTNNQTEKENIEYFSIDFIYYYQSITIQVDS